MRLVGASSASKSRARRTGGRVTGARWGMITVGLLTGWYLLPHLWRLKEERRLAEICETEGLLALTYDDGPGLSLTSRLLDLFAAEEAQATFFMVGRRVSERPDVARRVVELGHATGSHTQTHTNAWKTNPVRASRDMIEGMQSVARIGGNGRLYRPPYGKLTFATLLHAALRRLQFAWWTVDTRDSWGQRPAEEVLREVRDKGGAVVLMHDFDSYGADTDVTHEDYVLELTSRLLKEAGAQGLRVVTLPEIRRLLTSDRRAG